MSINTSNIVNAVSGALKGQRVICVDGTYYPVGIGGNFIPAGQGSGGSNGGDAGVSSGAFNIVKVTEYTPSRMSSINRITISGFEDDDYFENSEYNGEYVVTEETASESNWKLRKYLHTSGNYHLFFYDDGDWKYWGIAAPDSEEPAMYLEIDSNLESRTYGDWYSNISGENYQATVEIHGEILPTVIKAVAADSFNNGEWSFSSSEATYSKYVGPVEPIVDGIFVASGDALIGYGVDTVGAYMTMPLTADISGQLFNAKLEATCYGDTLSFYPADGGATGTAATFNGYVRIDTSLDVGFFRDNATIILDACPSSDGRMCFFAGTTDCYLGVDTIGGTYNMWAGNGSSWNIIESDSDHGRSDVEVVMDQWANIAYVHDKDAGAYRLYIDGVLAKEIESPELIKSGVCLRIGKWGNDGMGFQGQMRNFMIYNKALTAEEIATHRAKYSN